jgi:hypothetical protein
MPIAQLDFFSVAEIALRLLFHADWAEEMQKQNAKKKRGETDTTASQNRFKACSCRFLSRHLFY